VLKVDKRKGSPFWQITGTVVTPTASQLVRKSSGTTDQKQALEAASQLEARIRRELTYGVENETTFADAAHDYIKDKLDEGEPICSPKLADLIAEIGERKLASFSSGEVQDIAKRILPNAKAATRNRHGIAPFMSVYNFAVLRKKAPPMTVERFEEQQMLLDADGNAGRAQGVEKVEQHGKACRTARAAMQAGHAIMTAAEY
jgi:hypothetical protein